MAFQLAPMQHPPLLPNPGKLPAAYRMVPRGSACALCSLGRGVRWAGYTLALPGPHSRPSPVPQSRMCMCVYVCVCLMYVYVCVYTCVYTFVCVMCVCVCVCVYV